MVRFNGGRRSPRAIVSAARVGYDFSVGRPSITPLISRRGHKTTSTTPSPLKQIIAVTDLLARNVITTSREQNNMAASEQTSLLNEPTNGLDARKAFEGGNVEASRNFHDKRAAAEAIASNESWHQSEGGLLKPIIFGGLDGILTSFAIVAGAAGGRLPPQVVLVLGFSNIFADALSMGVGEFLSSKAENEWILSERKREEWELENYPEGEIREMIEIYESKGVSHEDAVLVINTMAKYKDFFVDIMMTQELELLVPEKDHVKQSFNEGVIMFCAFAAFGAMPLVGYVIAPISFPHLSQDYLFLVACAVTGVVLFLMGCVKSRFCPSHWLYCGAETLLLGGACATVAFKVGAFVDKLLA